ncbi:Hypothetical predicted protein [Paramuricea clavata]|uniref:Uncharacterized protein n=3 Tax=Paramuricea clavata TaxID=317549 RepID=A0A6S7HYJ4_PARCT|nr:Hypothetical predicted protein [Paramuricea clavata]
MEDGHEILSSARLRGNSRLLAETLSQLGSDDWGNISDISLVENVANEGQNSDEDCEILKFIEDTERDIAAKSTQYVKGILTRDKTANLYKRREKILDYCKSKIIECPKEKLVRRLNRTGGRSANEKLACDIIALVNFYSSREITAEFNDMFRKPLCDNTQDILKSLDKEETKQLMTFIENFDVKVSELREDFDQTVSQFKTEISDLKANLCEKQAKIRSLESELASFRGNYKANLEETRGKLENYEMKLVGQAENVIKLEQKTDKICKDLERIKKQQSKRIEVIDAERSEGSLDILYSSAVKSTEANASKDQTVSDIICMEVPQTKTANSNSGTNNKACSITSKQYIQQKQQKNDSSTSYANVSQPESTGSELSKQVQQSECSVTQIESNKANSNIDNTNFEDRESPDIEKETSDFVGVQRQKIKRIYLGGVREGTNAIKQYMQEKGIFPTFVRLFNSKRKGTVAVRINVKNDDFERVSGNDFWPEYVYSRPWLSKQNWINKNETKDSS